MEIGIQKIFAQLLFWLLEFLDTVFEMFQVLCGTQPVQTTVDGDVVTKTIVEIFMQSSTVTKAFLMIFLVAIIVAAFSVIVTVVKNIINMKGGERKSHAKTVGQGFGSIITTLVLAFVMIVGIWGSTEVLKGVSEATGGEKNITLANVIFDMCVKSDYIYDRDNPIFTPVPVLDENGKPALERDKDGNPIQKQNEEGDPVFDNDGNPVFIPIYEKDPNGNVIYTVSYDYERDEEGKPMKKGGWWHGDKPQDYVINFSESTVNEIFGVRSKALGLFETSDGKYITEPKVELKNFNFWLAFFVVIMMLIAIIWTMLGLVKRVYDLVILFLMLPLVSATVPLDDGARLKSWRETVISKVVLAYGAVISVNVFLLVTPIINNINFNNWSSFVSILFKCFMLIGGALCINGGQFLIARLMGTSADESREMAQSARALISGAVATGGIVRGAKNLAVGGTNKYNRYTGGILPTAGKAVAGVGNIAGNMLGGAAYRRGAGRVMDWSGNAAHALRGVGQIRRTGPKSSLGGYTSVGRNNSGYKTPSDSGNSAPKFSRRKEIQKMKYPEGRNKLTQNGLLGIPRQVKKKSISVQSV